MNVSHDFLSHEFPFDMHIGGLLSYGKSSPKFFDSVEQGGYQFSLNNFGLVMNKSNIYSINFGGRWPIGM